jgi:hypothetical protein
MSLAGVVRHRPSADDLPTEGTSAESSNAAGAHPVIRASALAPRVGGGVSEPRIPSPEAQARIVPVDPSRTAEYPAIDASMRLVGPSAAGANRATDMRAGTSAPRSIRLGVGVLALAAAGAVYLSEAKPAWLPKNVTGPVVTVTAHHLNTRTARTKVPDAMTLVKTTADASVYTIPVARYSLSVEITHPCWIMVRALPAGSVIFTRTLEPGGPMPTISAMGTASIAVAARATAIVISSGGRTIGTIPAPVVARRYIVEGAGGATPAPSELASTSF